MLYEITLWTLGLLGGSYALPYCIPSIRSSLRQIHTTIKTNTVFASECINDIQQGQLNAIDRTIGQIISALCQSIIVMWTCINILTEWSIEPLHNFVISYYLYDMIHIYIKPYGKTQSIFFLHHSLSIFLIAYVRYAELHYIAFMNTIYICMELSGLCINITNLLKYAYPTSKSNIVLSAINLMIYCILRQVIYGFTLLYYTVITELTYIYYIPAVLLYFLYFASLYWFILMAQKHKQMERKVIL
jgi:hypothetical protein